MVEQCGNQNSKRQSQKITFLFGQQNDYFCYYLYHPQLMWHLQWGLTRVPWLTFTPHTLNIKIDQWYKERKEGTSGPRRKDAVWQSPSLLTSDSEAGLPKVLANQAPFVQKWALHKKKPITRKYKEEKGMEKPCSGFEKSVERNDEWSWVGREMLTMEEWIPWTRVFILLFPTTLIPLLFRNGLPEATFCKINVWPTVYGGMPTISGSSQNSAVCTAKFPTTCLSVSRTQVSESWAEIWMAADRPRFVSAAAPPSLCAQLCATLTDIWWGGLSSGAPVHQPTSCSWQRQVFLTS